MSDGPIVVKVNKKTHKRCIKCKAWKAKDLFGQHDGNEDGKQVICYGCKNKAGKKDRERNSTARIRHHIGTRCMTQLGSLAPEGFIRDLETHLGYRIKKLIKHLRTDLKAREGSDRSLRDALNEGYHIDHIKPLSLYQVISAHRDIDTPAEEFVDWDVFKACWAIENLSAIPALENLQKGAKYDSDDDGEGNE